MIKILTTTLLILTSQAYGQLKVDCFAMGLIDDYSRRLIKEDTLDRQLIDEFAPPDFAFMDYIDSLVNRENSIQSNNKIVTNRVLNENNRCYLYYSKQLADKINKKYKFQYNNEKDPNLRTLYDGEVKRSCLKTDAERISFLMGAFLGFGKKQNDTYSYTIRRSKAKFSLIVKSLRKLKCSEIKTEDEVWIFEKVKKRHIESRTVTFKPSKHLITELNKLTGLMESTTKKRAAFYGVVE